MNKAPESKGIYPEVDQKVVYKFKPGDNARVLGKTFSKDSKGNITMVLVSDPKGKVVTITECVPFCFPPIPGYYTTDGGYYESELEEV